MLPEVEAEPREPVGPEPVDYAAMQTGEAPCIGSEVRDGAPCLVRDPGGPLAGLNEALGEIKQLLVQLAQVRDFGGPVVHLDVDVDVIIGAPGRIETVGPKSLKV